MLKARMLLSVVAVVVTVPAVAHAQLPQAPQVQVPEVQVPEVQVPEVEVPEVPPTPEVPVPDLPEPPTVPAPPPAPKVPAPSLPAPVGGGGGGASSGGGSSAAPTGGGSASSAAPSGGGSASSAAPSGGGGSTSASSGDGSSGGADDARTPVQRRRAERRLQRAVARLGGCLDELSRDQARVLVLRSGVGTGPPRTRRAVARAMDMRVRWVRKLERRGLRNARTIARSDGCGSAAAGGAIALPNGPDGSGPGAGNGAPEAGAGPAPSGADEHTGGNGRSGGASGPVLDETAAIGPPELGVSGSRGRSATGTSLWVAAGLMLLAALAGFATPSLRDRVREGQAMSAGP